MIKYINEISSLLTPIIAILTIYIAYRQYKVDRDNVKHALYERRYRIYLETREYLSFTLKSDQRDFGRNEAFSTYVSESRFLFKSDICSFLDNIYKKAMIYEYAIQQKYYDKSVVNETLIAYMKELAYSEYIDGINVEELEINILAALVMDFNSLSRRFQKYLSFKFY